MAELSRRYYPSAPRRKCRTCRVGKIACAGESVGAARARFCPRVLVDWRAPLPTLRLNSSFRYSPRRRMAMGVAEQRIGQLRPEPADFDRFRLRRFVESL